MINNIDINVAKDFIEDYYKERKVCNDNVVMRIAESRINAIENILSELETYKKIAEKLAEELSECGFEHHCDCCRTDICNAYEDNDEYIKCIIDWARNEVEKDG